MNNRFYQQRSITFALIFLFAVPATLFGFNVYINDELREEIPPSFLKNYTYPVPSEGRFTAGVSVLEILPLFSSVYKMEIVHAAGTETLRGDDTADRFRQWLFLPRPSGDIDLQTDEKTYRRIRELRLWGEELYSRQLSIWISWEGLKELKEELNRFADYHQLEFNILEVPSIDSKLTSAARGGGILPDLCMVQSDYLPALTESRVLQRLDYFELPGILDKGTAAFTREGSTWAVPFYFDTQLVFYNPELIDLLSGAAYPAAGWTLDEFEKLCSKLQAAGISPITWNAYSAYWLIPFQIGFGKDSVLEKDGSIVIDDEATEKALDYILWLKDMGYLDIRERDGMMGRFFSGDVAMILSGSYSIPEFERLGIPFETAPYPRNPAAGEFISPLLDFKAFAITRKTRHPVLARRVIEYLSGIGVQQRFCGSVSKLPAHTEAWNITKLQNPYYETLYESYRIGTIIPPEDSYKIYKNTMWKLLRFAITGEMSVEQTLSEGQNIINNKLKSRRD